MEFNAGDQLNLSQEKSTSSSSASMGLSSGTIFLSISTSIKLYLKNHSYLIIIKTICNL